MKRYKLVLPRRVDTSESKFSPRSAQIYYNLIVNVVFDIIVAVAGSL